MVFSADIGDPQGAGIYTDIGELTAEYQYSRNGEIIIDWSPIIRPNPNLRIIYLPLVTEYLGDDFFLTDIDTIHSVTIRITDKAGNFVDKVFQTKLDVITSQIDLTQTVQNADIFSVPFESRSLVNGQTLNIHYVSNSSTTPYLISIQSSDDHQIEHEYERTVLHILRM